MSIVATTLVQDCLVIGADSMTQIMRQDSDGNVSVIQSYQHTQKLYRVGKNVGVATWGAGNIGPRSIGSFIGDCARKPAASGPTVNVKEVAEELSQTFDAGYQEMFDAVPQENWPRLGAIVGGYSTGEPLAEVWEISIPGSGGPNRVSPPNAFGASWRGVQLPFDRLYRGIDPRIRSQLIEKGITQQEIDSYTSPFVFDAMPIQEAIDFVVFILRTTVDVSKFESGMSSCGGPLWILLLTRNGSEWVERPKWQVRR